MKSQTPKFKVGDIITNSRNQWRRLIRRVEYVERSGKIKVMYFYSIEELDEKYDPTGNFYNEIGGYCSQDHLVSWQGGKSKEHKLIRYKMYPPLGYQFGEGGYIDITNEKELRDCALGMSNDPKFKEKVIKASKEELVDFFKENGFEFGK